MCTIFFPNTWLKLSHHYRMTRRGARRLAGGNTESLTQSINEVILQDCHSLYIEGDDCLLNMGEDLGISIEPPRKKINIMLIGIYFIAPFLSNLWLLFCIRAIIILFNDYWLAEIIDLINIWKQIVRKTDFDWSSRLSSAKYKMKQSNFKTEFKGNQHAHLTRSRRTETVIITTVI